MVLPDGFSRRILETSGVHKLDVSAEGTSYHCSYFRLDGQIGSWAVPGPLGHCPATVSISEFRGICTAVVFQKALKDIRSSMRAVQCNNSDKMHVKGLKYTHNMHSSTYYTAVLAGCFQESYMHATWNHQEASQEPFLLLFWRGCGEENTSFYHMCSRSKPKRHKFLRGIAFININSVHFFCSPLSTSRGKFNLANGNKMLCCYCCCC